MKPRSTLEPIVTILEGDDDSVFKVDEYPSGLELMPKFRLWEQQRIKEYLAFENKDLEFID